MEQQKATIILHSGDMDKVYSALIIGNGALAMALCPLSGGYAFLPPRQPGGGSLYKQPEAFPDEPAPRTPA